MKCRDNCALISLFILLAAVVLTTAGQESSKSSEKANTPSFSKVTRSDLARARANDLKSLTLVIAAKPGQAAAVAREIEKIGGTIKVQVARVDYLRVVVPVTQVDSVFHLSSIEAAEFQIDREQSSFSLPPYRRRPDDAGIAMIDKKTGPTTNAAWPPTPSDYPFKHPYTPFKDLAADDWRAEHPTWDGRGVIMADLESAPDILIPELQEGLTLDGKPARKLVDIITAAGRDPVDPPKEEQSFAGLWITMRDSVAAERGKIFYNGETYSAPHDGSFKIKVLDMNNILWGSLGKPFNPNYWAKDPPTGRDAALAILWDESANTVWVDTNQNHDFTDERALMDYSIRGDVGVFGKDDPATSDRETVGFVVQTDRRHSMIGLEICTNEHATALMTSAAGQPSSQTPIQGIAPAARLISVEVDFTRAGTAERYISTFLDPRVDIIFKATASPVNRLRNGSQVSSIILKRLIDYTKKPFFEGAGNGQGMATTDADAMPANSFAVGAYQSRESYLVSTAAITLDIDNMHAVSEGGPAGNGAVKPDFLVPSGHLAAYNGWTDASWQRLNSSDLFRMYPGYNVSSGTSQASSVAAGAAALLISAAKQADIPYDGWRLRHALLASVRYLNNLPQYEQGNGLVQVALAWEELKRLANAPQPVTIESRASVKTTSSSWLSPPDSGVGLYEREGWQAGQRETKTITFTRKDGPKEPMKFDVRWVGNDATFASSPSITLPLGQPVDLRVTVAPARPGGHSAIVELAGPGEKDWTYRTACTVIASYQFDKLNDTLTIQDSLSRPGLKQLFLNVPSGVRALVLQFTGGLAGGKFFAEFHRPHGSSAGSSIVDFDCRWNPSCRTITKIIPNPEPGVWGIGLNGAALQKFYNPAHPTEPVTPVPFTLTASLLGTDIKPISASSNLSTGTINLTVHNHLAPFTGGVSSTAIASGFQTPLILKPGEQRIFTVNVPEGSTSLVGTIQVKDGSQSDIDLYVFDCTSGKSCSPVDPENTSVDGNEMKYIAKPKAGVWKFVVDGADVRGGKVDVEYSDFVSNPRYGSVAATDNTKMRKTASEWTVLMHIWNISQIALPRRPYAIFSVDNSVYETSLDVSQPPPDRVPIGWSAHALPLGAVSQKSESP